jgi:pilus biogenesis lipoprotein CpaD
MFQRNSLKLLAAALATSACVPLASPSDSPKQLHIHVAAESYVVKLAPRGKALPAGEKQELDQYLSHLGDLQNVEFSLRRTHKGQQLSSLVPVEKELLARGADPRKIVNLAEIGVDYHGQLVDVEIISKRYVADTADCPDWSRPDTMDRANLNSSDFGCATAAALAMSIADPRDLARGRDIAPASGVHSAASVDRYNTDQVKALNATTTEQKQN